MRVVVLIDPARARRWHLRVVEALRRDGHAVAVSLRSGPQENQQAGRAVACLQALERHLYRIDAENASGALEPTAFAGPDSDAGVGQADCCVDFTGGGSVPASLSPLFDGSTDELAAVAALLENRAPTLEVACRRSEGGHEVVASARPAIESPSILTQAFDQVAVGMMRLVLRTVRQQANGGGLTGLAAIAPASRRSPAAVRFAVTSLAEKVAGRLTRLVVHPEHWSIGWRRIQGDAVRDRLAWPQADYATVPDDLGRYYADPFVFLHEGAAHVFCEEYPYATRRGIVSHFVIAPDGSVTTPRSVLEAPYHLSYPFVFAEKGEIWMIPETSANRTVELFRAERFPDRWTREAVLLDGVVAGDATLATHAGRRWLFATLAGDGGSTWDALGLFHAADLFGPWQPHPGNPVLIDAGAARPAGAMFTRAGRLLRPVQDCVGGYGAALALCEVSRLDPDGYAQSVVARLGPRPGWHADGVHTLNEAGGIEVIDRVARRRRF